MSRMTDLSRRNGVFHQDMKRVRYSIPDEIYPHVYHHQQQQQQQYLPYDMPRGNMYYTQQFHRTRPFHVSSASAEEQKLWAPPSNIHTGYGSSTPVQMRDDTTTSVANPKPQDIAASTRTTKSGEVSTQDAAQLLLTAASALTSLTKQSPLSVSKSRDEVSPTIENQQTLVESKDIVKKKSGREKATKFPVKVGQICCDILSYHSNDYILHLTLLGRPDRCPSS